MIVYKCSCGEQFKTWPEFFVHLAETGYDEARHEYLLFETETGKVVCE